MGWNDQKARSAVRIDSPDERIVSPLAGAAGQGAPRWTQVVRAAMSPSDNFFLGGIRVSAS